MILVDSSAWIEYYRRSGSPEVRAAVAAVIDADLAAVNGVIQVEIIGFASDEAHRRKLASDFDTLHWLELETSSFDLATELGFKARRKGITVPAADLIIAASALESSSTLYHVDSHFDLLVSHAGLKARNLRGGVT